MDMIFDTATGALTIDTGTPEPWGASLRAVLTRHGQVIDLTGVEMRLTITADGAEVFDLHLPPPGVRYRRTDQDVLATGHVRWQPGQSIAVSAWCRTRAGHEVTAEASFDAPHVPVNINHADSAELQALLGIGPERAAAIIAGRPWSDPADLSSISGISAAMVAAWLVAPGLVVGEVE